MHTILSLLRASQKLSAHFNEADKLEVSKNVSSEKLKKNLTIKNVCYAALFSTAIVSTMAFPLSRLVVLQAIKATPGLTTIMANTMLIVGMLALAGCKTLANLLGLSSLANSISIPQIEDSPCKEEKKSDAEETDMRDLADPNKVFEDAYQESTTSAKAAAQWVEEFSDMDIDGLFDGIDQDTSTKRWVQEFDADNTKPEKLIQTQPVKTADAPIIPSASRRLGAMTFASNERKSSQEVGLSAAVKHQATEKEMEVIFQEVSQQSEMEKAWVEVKKAAIPLPSKLIQQDRKLRLAALAKAIQERKGSVSHSQGDVDSQTLKEQIQEMNHISRNLFLMSRL